MRASEMPATSGRSEPKPMALARRKYRSGHEQRPNVNRQREPSQFGGKQQRNNAGVTAGREPAPNAELTSGPDSARENEKR